MKTLVTTHTPPRPARLVRNTATGRAGGWRWPAVVTCVLGAAALVGCAAPDPDPMRTPPSQQGPAAGLHPAKWPVRAWALVGQELRAFDPRQPGQWQARVALTGLPPGERLVGIDFRVARGVLYGLGQSGRLYTLDTVTGAAQALGSAPASSRATVPHGVDFNPVADRVRVVAANGDNLRWHPDMGAAVDFDPAREGAQPDPTLAYVPGDPHAGQSPELVAAAYSYNTRDPKLTTNFAIDRLRGTLVLQGSREGAQPVVSPNLGRLSTVGPLGLGPLADASFDISDLGNIALAAVRRAAPAQADTLLVQIDLDTGAARPLGRLGDGAPVQGLAIEP